MTGVTIWLTGLSGAGKSTIAKRLKFELQLLQDRRVHVLDGDEWRAAACRDLGFSKEDRDENIRRASYVAAYLANTEQVCIAAFISPYDQARKFAASLHDRFFLVHVDCALEVCEKRDVKGLYAKARAGQIKGFTGIDDPYEEPLVPDVRVDTNLHGIDATVHHIIDALKKKGWVYG